MIFKDIIFDKKAVCNFYAAWFQTNVVFLELKGKVFTIVVMQCLNARKKKINIEGNRTWHALV